MIMKNEPPELITPKEAAALSNKFGTADDIYRANDIYQESMKLNKYESDDRWKFLCAIAAIYTAGRIQGIREERGRSTPQIKHKGLQHVNANFSR